MNRFVFLLFFLLISCSDKVSIIENQDFTMIKNRGGKTLGYDPQSGVKILIVDNLAFKDLNKNNQLDDYEDWRLPVEDRAEDLAGKLTIEDIAGLMLYSSHQSIPGAHQGWRSAKYGGLSFYESGAEPSDLSDEQIKFIEEDNLRHVLITNVKSSTVAAKWNNNIQSLSESIGFGIPVNISSDPRHGNDSYAEFTSGQGGRVSSWPSSLGLSASFDPDLMKEFGRVASIEYRSLGIATALSPQIDLASDPRWGRFEGTMGEDPNLVTDLARSYVDGFQSTNTKGWGVNSVNTMIKHWPGGGTGEGGRDGHYGFGSYAVYPGDNIEEHMKIFTEGALNLRGNTLSASAIMPYYTIALGNGEEVGSAYNNYLISNILRDKYQYDGVLCTDWGITGDAFAVDVFFSGKSFGVENLTVAERHYKALMSGMDQFGGNNDMIPVLEAFKIGVEEYGEDFMRNRFEKSAVRLLKNIFNVGLFENPYLDYDKSSTIIASEEFDKMGKEAQKKSIVMLKNDQNTLPINTRKKVYMPMRKVPKSINFFGQETPESMEHKLNILTLLEYYEVVDDPSEADFAIVSIESPDSGYGYDKKDVETGGNGYLPISLQYSPYTAKFARDESISGGSIFEDFNNRSYNNKSIKTKNESDMKLVHETYKLMNGKPLILIVRVYNPLVFSEIEPYASSILIDFGVESRSMLELLSGKFEPSGLLPFQMPIDMKTVELQKEDIPRDMIPYIDSKGNEYDFAYGMNWKGVINDKRVKKYK